MIFLDTGAFLARHLPRDQHHDEAVRGFQRLEQQGLPILTSCHVVDETITLLGRWAGRAFAAERGRSILGSSRLQIARPSLSQELAALDEFERFADHEVSFTDCISFVLMGELKIRDVFGFDADFRLAGFRLWPGGA